MSTIQPMFKHDCSICIFLGQFFDGNTAYSRYDLYFCDQAIGGKTIVARCSSEGPDYVSGLNAPHPALVAGREMAERRGLL